MSEPETPTAIICGNDVLAAGAIVRARQQGIGLPQQVSITGFDDIGLATSVALTGDLYSLRHRRLLACVCS